MLKSGIIYTFNFSHILMLISLWAAMEVEDHIPEKSISIFS